MTKTKIFTLIYYIALAISIILLVNISISISTLLASDLPANMLYNEYGSLQKSAGIYGIVCFILLLIISLGLYYFSSKSTYILLSNIFYIAIILFVFINANRLYFTSQGLNYSEKSEYWITVFMGIFYIIGAVLVSAIGFITVRNYTKQAKHTINKK